jgi:virginiamycin B lyase
VDARTGQVTEYAAPTAQDPHTPVFGPDGALWFTAQSSNLVVRMDTKTGAMREFRVPTPNARPYGIVVGPDGALWFCEFGVNRLGRIDPKTGKITEYEVPAPDARPRRLSAQSRPRPAIYFTDFAGGRLGRFDLERMSFKLWVSPSGPRSRPYGIAADSDGYLWYNEFSANQLVRFDPESEKFQRFTLPSPRSEVRHMARDAHGRVWMALSGANKLAVIQ